MAASRLWTSELRSWHFRPRCWAGCCSQSSWPGKAFFDFLLYRSTAWLAAETPGAISARHQHFWQLGRYLLFSSFPLQRLQAPERVRQYMHAYRKLQPHRLRQPDALGYDVVMREPLFFNRQLTDADRQPFAWETGPA